MIILIFGSRGLASVLAHALPHSVIGLTLPPIDANTLFINCVGLSDRLEKRYPAVGIDLSLQFYDNASRKGWE